MPTPSSTTTSNPKKDAKYYLNLFNISKQKRQEMDNKWRILDAFYKGEQWDLTNYPEWKPKPVTNWIWKVATSKAANLSSGDYRGALIPNSAEDVESIQKLQKIYDTEWDRLDVPDLMRQAILRSQVIGTGVLHIGYDDSIITGGTNTRAEGEIVLGVIDPASIFPDPSAYTLEECAYVCVRERKTKTWIQAQKQFKSNFENKDVDFWTSPLDAADRGEIYNNDYTTSQENIVDFLTFYEKIPDEKYGYIFQATYIANGRVLYKIEDMMPREYPLVFIRASRELHSMWGRPTTELVLDSQKMLNKLESIMADLSMINQNPPKIVSADSGISADDVAMYGSAAGAVFTTKSGSVDNAIGIVKHAMPTAEMNSMFDRTVNNIKDITNLTNAYTGGNIGTAGNTSGGTETLVEQAKLPDLLAIKEIESAVESLSRKLISFIITKYTSPHFVRTITKVSGQPVEYNFEKFVGKDFNEITFDFEVNVMARIQDTPAKRKSDAMELYTIQNQYSNAGMQIQVVTPEELIDALEPYNKDLILQRIRNDAQVKNDQNYMAVAKAITDIVTRSITEQGVAPDIQVTAQFVKQMFEPNVKK